MNAIVIAGRNANRLCVKMACRLDGTKISEQQQKNKNNTTSHRAKCHTKQKFTGRENKKKY